MSAQQKPGLAERHGGREAAPAGSVSSMELCLRSIMAQASASQNVSHGRLALAMSMFLIGACCERGPAPSSANDVCDPEVQDCGFGLDCVLHQGDGRFECAIACNSDCDCPSYGEYGSWRCGTEGFCYAFFRR